MTTYAYFKDNMYLGCVGYRLDLETFVLRKQEGDKWLWTMALEKFYKMLSEGKMQSCTNPDTIDDDYKSIQEFYDKSNEYPKWGEEYCYKDNGIFISEFWYFTKYDYQRLNDGTLYRNWRDL